MIGVNLALGLKRYSPLTPAFSPADVAGILSWHDAQVAASILNASDTQATNGQAIKTWQDQAGSARHLQQGTAGNRPTLDTGGSIFTNPCIDFDEVNAQFLITSTTQPADTPAFTVFLVWAPKVGVNNAAIVYNSNQAGVGSFFLEDSGTDTFYMNCGASVLGSAYTPGTKYVTTLVFNGASSKHYKNGTLIGTANPGSRNLAGFCLGAYITGGDPTHMKVGEIIHYNSELSAGNRGSVESYLIAKHGVV